MGSDRSDHDATPPSTWESQRELVLNGVITLMGRVVFYDQQDGRWFAFATFDAFVAIEHGDTLEFELFGSSMTGVVTNVSVRRGLTPLGASTVRIEPELSE